MWEGLFFFFVFPVLHKFCGGLGRTPFFVLGCVSFFFSKKPTPHIPGKQPKPPLFFGDPPGGGRVGGVNLLIPWGQVFFFLVPFTGPDNHNHFFLPQDHQSPSFAGGVGCKVLLGSKGKKFFCSPTDVGRFPPPPLPFPVL